MTRDNLDSLKAIYVWLNEQGIGYRGIPFAPIGRGALSPELQLTPAQVKQAADLWAMELMAEDALRPNQGITFDECFDFSYSLVYMCRACKGARYIAYVSANGDVYPCTMCAGVGEFCVGNVIDSTFEEIWERSAKSFRQLSRWDAFETCRSCALSGGKYFCTGRCPPLSLLYRGSPLECGATAYDRATLVYRTRMLPQLFEHGTKQAGGS